MKYIFTLVILGMIGCQSHSDSKKGTEVGIAYSTQFIAEEKYDYGNESILEEEDINKEQLRDFVNDLIQKVRDGELKAYSPIDMTLPLDPNTLNDIWLKRDTIYDYNSETGITTAIPYEDEFDFERVTHVRFKESWFWNEDENKMTKEITAVCPLIMSFSPKGDYRGKAPLFWIPLP